MFTESTRLIESLTRRRFSIFKRHIFATQETVDAQPQSIRHTEARKNSTPVITSEPKECGIYNISKNSISSDDILYNEPRIPYRRRTRRYKSVRGPLRHNNSLTANEIQKDTVKCNAHPKKNLKSQPTIRHYYSLKL